MAYQPGPFILQSAGNVGIETSDYNFAGYAADQLGDVETIPAGWKDFLDDAAVLMAEPSDPFPDVDLSAAMHTLDAYSDPESFLGIGDMVTALGVADIQLGSAIGSAPAEAWVDTPGTFVPPGPAETLGVPFIPPNAIDFSVTGSVGSTTTTVTPPLGYITPNVTFTNLSQYGSSNFRVGDEWQATATGGKGQTVYVYATFNGRDIGGGPQGDIGLDGKREITGVMGADQVGVWQEQWWIGSSIIATYNFVVVAE